VNAKRHWSRNENVSPSGLCDDIFLVPVAYATGKYVPPSGLRKQAVMLCAGFTPPAGNRLNRIVSENSERTVSVGVDSRVQVVRNVTC